MPLMLEWPAQFPGTGKYFYEFDKYSFHVLCVIVYETERWGSKFNAGFVVTMYAAGFFDVRVQFNYSFYFIFTYWKTDASITWTSVLILNF